LCTSYAIERLAANWAAARPYYTPADTPQGDYAAARQARFRIYLDRALHQLPPVVRADLDARFAARRAANLPAYQRQMTLLMTLDAASYQDHRTPLPLHQARVALVLRGEYYLLDACARDDNGNLLVYPLDSRSDGAGFTLPLHDAGNGTLRDPHGRPVMVDRRGRVKIGTMAVGMLRPPTLEAIKRHVAGILQQASAESTGTNTDPAQIADVLLAQAPRERQAALRALLGPAAQAELQALRAAPILINWDIMTAVNRSPLSGARIVGSATMR
jgi:hypothetical protein